MRYVLVALLCCGLFLSCARKVSDEEAIKELIDELENVLGMGEHYTKEEGDTATQEKSYVWVFWYRSVDSANVKVKVNITGDSAFVEINKMVYGVFHRFPAETLPPETLIDKPKPLEDLFIRYATFEKTGPRRHHRGWCLKRLSDAKVESQLGGPNIGIDSVKVIAGNDSLIIKDPFEFSDTLNVLNCSQGEKVKVYTYISPVDTPCLVFLHAPGYTRHIRRICSRLGNGIFYGECEVMRKGFGRIAVDVIWKPSLFEDDETTYPYCSRAWIINIRCR